MVLSWLKDGGARQFMGYTITTWFGAQGWGTQGLFVDTAGLTTANEAFHFTNTGIVEKIRSYGIPDMMDFRFTEIKSNGNFPVTPGLQRWAVDFAKSGKSAPEVQKALQERVGHLHDRDVVCFYGDPALDARIANGRWTVEQPKMDGEALVLTLHAKEGVRDGTVWVRLPGSWAYAPAVLKASESLGQPDLTLDNMIRFPNAKPVSGDIYHIQIHGAARKGE